jgi:uncharacterized protein
MERARMADSLREQLFTFSRHLRDPAHCQPPPGIEARRMKVYRDLFFNSLQGLLASGFPVIRRTLDESKWRSLVRTFYAEYRATTPLFTEIAGEFVTFLQARSEHGDDPPWLAELAHYEWMETHLQLSDALLPPHDPAGDLLDQVPVLSPFAMALGYRWPVTQITRGYAPTRPPTQPTLVMLHRDANHRVNFAEISPPVYRLIVSISEHRRTGREHLAALAAEAGMALDSLLAHGLDSLNQLRSRGIVLGTQQ